MAYFWIALGGAAGSLTRFSLGKRISTLSDASFPLATFLINISGAVLLGIVSALKLEGNFYLLTADGFLGAYTTFSTFMFEGFNLFKEKKILNAMVYVVGSLFLGVLGFVIGLKLVGYLKS